MIGPGGSAVCNLYNIRSNQQAIIEAAGAMRDGVGNLPPDLDVGKNGYAKARSSRTCQRR